MRTDSPFDSLVAADLDQLLNAATQERSNDKCRRNRPRSGGTSRSNSNRPGPVRGVVARHVPSSSSTHHWPVKDSSGLWRISTRSKWSSSALRTENNVPCAVCERLVDAGALARGLCCNEAAFGISVELFDVAPCGVAPARMVLEFAFVKREVLGGRRCEDFRQIFAHGAELENGQRRVLLQLGDAGEMFLARPAAVIADTKPEDPMIEAG